MKIEQAIAFVLFAIVAAMTPGPSNLLLTSTGATVGVRRGLPCLAGVALGMGTMIFLVGFGLGSIVLENLVILQIIRWSGVAFLLWLSWKIATAGRTRETTSTPGARRTTARPPWARASDTTRRTLPFLPVIGALPEMVQMSTQQGSAQL